MFLWGKIVEYGQVHPQGKNNIYNDDININKGEKYVTDSQVYLLLFFSKNK